MKKTTAAPRPRRRRRNERLYRAALGAVLALALGGGAYGGLRASHTREGEAVLARAGHLLLQGSALFGLRVADIRVIGRQTTDRETILAALGAKSGTPILAVSPSRARARLEALPWVRSAAVERRLPDTIRVRLVERRPLALWQHAGKIELIDRDGAVIPVRHLSRFAKLPLVVGDDAAPLARGLLDMLASQPALAARVTTAVRVGGRRWNLRLDDGVEVLLPEDEAKEAWAELAQLERAHSLLERAVETIDLRLPDRLVIRVAPQQPAKKNPTAKKERSATNNT